MAGMPWPGDFRMSCVVARCPEARSRLAAFATWTALRPSEVGAAARRGRGHATPRRRRRRWASRAWDWRWWRRPRCSGSSSPTSATRRRSWRWMRPDSQKGQMTVGVAGEHAGITGRAENCQTVVFLAYVTARAHALLDFALPAEGLAQGQEAARAAEKLLKTWHSLRRPSLSGRCWPGCRAARRPTGGRGRSRTAELEAVRAEVPAAGKGHASAVPVQPPVQAGPPEPVKIGAETAAEAGGCCCVGRTAGAGRGRKGDCDDEWAWVVMGPRRGTGRSSAAASPTCLPRASIATPQPACLYPARAYQGRGKKRRP